MPSENTIFYYLFDFLCSAFMYWSYSLCLPLLDLRCELGSGLRHICHVNYMIPCFYKRPLALADFWLPLFPLRNIRTYLLGLCELPATRAF